MLAQIIIWSAAVMLLDLPTYLERREYKGLDVYTLSKAPFPLNATDANWLVRLATDAHNVIVVVNGSCDDALGKLEGVMSTNPDCRMSVRASTVTRVVGNYPLLPARSAIVKIRTTDQIELNHESFPPLWFSTSVICIVIGGMLGIGCISGRT